MNLKRFLVGLGLIAQVLAAQASGEAASRTFEFSYALLASEFPGTEAVDIYIPLPAEHEGQRILEHSVIASIDGKTGQDLTFANGYYHVHRPANVNGPVSVQLNWTIQRATSSPKPPSPPVIK